MLLPLLPPPTTIDAREDHWQISSDFVRNSCIHLATLADKDDGFKENASLRLTAMDGDLINRKCLLPPYGSSLNDHGNSSLSFHCTLDGTKMSRAASVLKLHGYMKENDIFGYMKDL
jgi:hypothetical protein